MDILGIVSLVVGIFNILVGMLFLLQVSSNQEEFPGIQLTVANGVIGICFINGILLVTNGII
jgi:hypothetical protein